MPNTINNAILKTFIRACVQEALRRGIKEEVGPAPGVVSATASTNTDQADVTQPTTTNIEKPTSSAAVAGQIKRAIDANTTVRNNPDLLATIRDMSLGFIPSMAQQKGKTGTALTTATVQAANKAGRKTAEDAAARIAAKQAQSTPTGPAPATEK